MPAADAGATGDAHFVAYPTDPGRRNGAAVLFLGGSAGPASVVYDAQVGRSWQSSIVTITAANSIIGRAVGLLDHLAVADSRWNTYLTDDPTSPYSTPHHPNGVRPNWAKIVVAGHSQGSGNAAFLAIQIPVRRVVLFSAPNDHVGTVTAQWITRPSRTPLAGYWGIRNATEGSYGDFTAQNWSNLGGTGGPGVGGTGHNIPVPVGSGSGDPGASQRLVTTDPDSTTLRNHNSTAYDAAAGPAVVPAWTVLLGNG